jgi:hypothetical protein
MKKSPIIFLIVIIFVLLGAYWIYYLNNVHSTFEKYYTFRGCVELIQKTDSYGLCKLDSGTVIKIVKYENRWYLDGDLPFDANVDTNASSTGTSLGTQIEYLNTKYGFSFSLPSSWKGYSIITSNWEGSLIDSPASPRITGPELSIRHPLWTSEKPRQDIPIMIFTPDEWGLIQQEKLSVSAAPIGPSLLGYNSRYFFALPARYNYAFPTGFEEVTKIIESNPLHIINMI